MDGKSRGKFLITGGTGFIGSYLAMELLKSGRAEHCILADSNPDMRRVTGFTDLYKKHQKQITFVHCDIGEFAQVLALFDNHDPESVFHLGALLSAGADANPTEGFEVDLLGTRHVFEAARLYRQHRGPQQGPPVKVVFPSTIASFGLFLPPGLVKNESVQMPTTMYGVAKVASERLGEWYHSRRPEPWIDFRAVRFPSVIGAARGPGGTTVYSTLMVQQPVQGKAYEAYVSGDTRLDIIYVKDAVRALIGLHDADNARLKRRVYNIAGIRSGGQAPTADEIKKAVEALDINPKPAPITFKVNQQLQDTVHSFGVLDAAAARDDWGWELQWTDLPRAVQDFATEVKEYPDRIKAIELY
jgi:nucleoside-diphosphate-sugar epimerase